MDEKFNRETILKVVVAQYVALTLIIGVWVWWSGESLLDRLFFSWKAVLVGTLGGALIPPVTFFIASFFPNFEESIRWIQRQIIGPLRISDAPLIAVLSGVIEELFFRWMLQLSLGVFFANVIFGLFHLGSRSLIPYAVWTFAIGMLLSGFMSLADGNLLAPIIAHFMNNLIAIVTTKLSEEEEYA